MAKRMKASGIDWIGDIPEDWEVGKIKRGFLRKKEKAYDENPIILSLTSEGIKIRDVSTNEGQIAESYYEYNTVKIGDLLLNPMDLVSNAFSSISHIEGVISPAYFNLKNKEGFVSSYYDYYFKLQYWFLTFYSHGKGVSSDHRWTLNYQTLMNYFIPITSEKEQNKIADYLDQKCEEIDSTIEKQKLVIEKLKQYKQSIITEAVTKGLVFNVKMKPSGIEWIGDIPKNWECKKMKYFTQIDTEKLSENTDEDFEFDYLDIGSVEKFGKISITEHLSFSNSPSRARMILHKNDIIISTVRTYLRAIAVIEESDRFIASTGFAVIAVKREYDYKYFFYQSLSEPIVQEIVKNSVGISYPAINTSKLKEIKYLLPPLPEQQAIADYLDQKCAEIDKTIEMKEKLIEKLSEYKKSLIYESVTGKREVMAG